jgi:hypothetical protein
MHRSVGGAYVLSARAGVHSFKMVLIFKNTRADRQQASNSVALWVCVHDCLCKRKSIDLL